jgi:hypothetical protein
MLGQPHWGILVLACSLGLLPHYGNRGRLTIHPCELLLDREPALKSVDLCLQLTHSIVEPWLLCLLVRILRGERPVWSRLFCQRSVYVLVTETLEQICVLPLGHNLLLFLRLLDRLLIEGVVLTVCLQTLEQLGVEVLQVCILVGEPCMLLRSPVVGESRRLLVSQSRRGGQVLLLVCARLWILVLGVILPSVCKQLAKRTVRP